VSVALIWKYLLNNSFGVVAIFLGRLGFTSDWYGGVKSALPTMILIDVWEWTPFVFLILLAGIISLPVNIYETARMDGASKWQIFNMGRAAALSFIFLAISICLTVTFIKVSKFEI